jgi:hypothetical protein
MFFNSQLGLNHILLGFANILTILYCKLKKSENCLNSFAMFIKLVVFIFGEHVA